MLENQYMIISHNKFSRGEEEGESDDGDKEVEDDSNNEYIKLVF
jgi:hypothetical protein